MQNLQFPLQLKFKIAVLNPQFSVTDAGGKDVAYVKQKAFKLREDISVYTSSAQTKLQYKIKADRWLDFNASYALTRPDGTDVGRLVRKGARSLWKAAYELYDENGKQDLLLQEDNAWVRVLDGLVGEIPVLGMLTGMFLNPTYNITRPDGTLVARLKKKADLISRAFTLEQVAPFEEGEETRIVLGTMMMVVLERTRG